MRGRGTSFCRQPLATSEQSDLLSTMLIGNSAAMQEIAAIVRQVAMFPATVLLQGESGTGKEVVARAIHALSDRSAYPFRDINCAAIPETLLESELFGVEAGAFTDAKFLREGHLLRADGGTLFLDEIGSMPLTLQAKLLRVLETRSFRRVGGTKEIHVDLRIISATNVDLPVAVERRLFRDDLFYRLNVISITMPPLRERIEDLEPLAEHFLRLHSAEGAVPLCLHPEALELMRRYSWPGNIRELRSAIQHGQVLCTGSEIRPADLPAAIRMSTSNAQQRLQDLQEQMHLPPDGLDLSTLLRRIEQRFVREALEQCNGNQVQAAALLQISRDQLRYRLPKGLRAPS